MKSTDNGEMWINVESNIFSYFIVFKTNDCFKESIALYFMVYNV